MKKDWAVRFRELIEDRGLTMKSVSLAAGLNAAFVRDMLERGRVPSIDKFAKLAGVLGTSVAELMGEVSSADATNVVPVVGYVGAGAEVLPDFEQVPPEGLDQVQVPFPLPADMIALQVKGDSMMPQFRDGAVIVVYREQRRSLESFYGEEAAVRTVDGRRFIKTIMRGSSKAGVNLISWNAAPIENVRLAWVGEIFTVFPSGSSLRRAERQGGVQGSLRLRA